MANSFYTHTGYPQNSAELQAGDQRAESLAVQAAFDKLPALAGNANKIVVVNSSGDGLGVMNKANVPKTAWTMVLSCTTPGNLAVTYTTQAGSVSRTGDIFLLTFHILTATFTHTTASGSVSITGLPSGFDAQAANVSTLMFGGITKAGYTQFGLQFNSSGAAIIVASGSAVAPSAVDITQMPTGGVVELRGTIAMLGI